MNFRGVELIGWRIIRKIVLEESLSVIKITEDELGVPINLKRVRINVINVPEAQAANLWYRVGPSASSGISNMYNANAILEYKGNSPAIFELQLVDKYVFRIADKQNAYRQIYSTEKMVQGDSIKQIRLDYTFGPGTVIVVEGVDYE